MIMTPTDTSAHLRHYFILWVVKNSTETSRQISILVMGTTQNSARRFSRHSHDTGTSNFCSLNSTMEWDRVSSTYYVEKWPEN